jgi:uncharacterized protein YndB with AHSA1/START domain
MSSTRISRHVNAPREAVYRALLDAHAVSKWKVPTRMTCHVHEFDAREGGSFRISLTYEAPTATGKTTPHSDTAADNEIGWRMALDKLAALVEAG